MVRTQSERGGTRMGGKKRPERQKRLVLFIRDPGEIRCHSDLMILQQEWTLSPCLQKKLPGLLMMEKARDDSAGSPRGY
ncbi:hypothetical protein NDU88_006035 [Pleurodeles waltl]|uniref:Uncharacterized protein n=1 Tax=Pleurodeles waltl TaxID=8319 RepID=A0AAV7X0B1_PLEWA|nr:hypothetical protein NDU88_006035 [Pleurodeles waltl]